MAATLHRSAAHVHDWVSGCLGVMLAVSASQRYDAGPSKQPGQDILYVDSALAIGGIEAFVTCETKCFRAELIRGLTCVVSGEDNNSKRLGDLHKLAPAACFLLMLPWHQNRVQKHT